MIANYDAFAGGVVVVAVVVVAIGGTAVGEDLVVVVDFVDVVGLLKRWKQYANGSGSVVD